MNKIPPRIHACWLYEQADSKGRKYLKGRMGGMMVLVSPNNDPSAGSGAPFRLQFAAPFAVPADRDNADE
jgi:hypothetical protein